ncbi:competence type IV pilus minor pilin ComGD [Vagococcus vulneris]|uniref:Prepilin-type cleavage/methylation domain-containing protein n=1 Tax=Vagococcus vulneris TaxID=1977869 RepID=A0A430A070_9ENTE|nr:competence type IV pilus minor pilin ComGD [Vagococcus vulneris]RST99733.1 hypothetical protein CBF37_03130 [Vagococcus vulneris]
MNDKYQGFTLIELLVVLVVSTFFLLCPLFMLSGWSEQLTNEHTLQQFERNYYRTQYHAIVTGRSTAIHVDFKGEQTIFFRYRLHGQPSSSKTKETILKFPTTLFIKEAGSVIDLSGSGAPKTIHKFVFRDTIKNEDIIYKTQIGSGKLVRQNEKN